MSEPFWQKNSLVTHIFFDLCLFKPFCPVANFEQQSIVAAETIEGGNYSREETIRRNAVSIIWLDPT